MRIIAEQFEGRWSAWVEPNPGVAFGGETATVAIGRLATSLGVDPAKLEAEYNLATNRVEFRITP